MEFAAKNPAWWRCYFAGFLRILWCSEVVNRGEVVVECVVNVVTGWTLFPGWKSRQDFQVYFLIGLERQRRNTGVSPLRRQKRRLRSR
jgi:hypothetical protein